MSARVQLKHLLIDVDFFDKPTVRALAFKHTQVAALLYIRWLMLMSRATNALVTRDALASIAREVLHGMGTSIATFESVLQYCLDTGMIYEEKPGLFTAERVVKDQESCAVKRSESADRQRKFREKKSAVTNALLTRLPDTVSVSDTDTGSDLGSKDLDPKKNGTAFVPSGKYDTPTIQKYIPIIQAKLKANGRTFDEIAFEALCMRLNNDIPRIEKALVFTASLTKVLNVVEPSAQNHTSSAVKKTSLDVLNEISAGLK